MLARDLEGEADFDLAYLTGGPDLGIQASISDDYGHRLEGCFVVSTFIPSSFLDLLSMAIAGVEAMSEEFILEVGVDALEP